MAARVQERLQTLGAKVNRIDLPSAEIINDAGERIAQPLGPAVYAIKRPDAKVKVFLGIHIDTVFAVDHPFQSVREVDANTLNGPGVVDAKGGLVVLLTALEALERSGFAQTTGWEVLINPDEEIGSPSSVSLLSECAKRNHFGLVFEPALPDGNLVGARKGSGVFTFVIHGKAAHAGRDFGSGRNAIVAAAELVRELHRANTGIDSSKDRDINPGEGVTFNIGKITGGGPSNVVPDRCVVTLNVRTMHPHDIPLINRHIEHAAETAGRIDGIRVETFGGFSSPPKPLDELSQKLLDIIIQAGRQLDLNLTYRPSGGTCDGNKLAAAGLPVIDSMGPRGGHLHSPEEFVSVDSLAERAKLTLLTLHALGK